MTAGEIEGVGEEEVDGRSTVVICFNYLSYLITIITIIIMSLLSFHHNVLEAEGRTAVDCSSVLRNVLSKSAFRLVVMTWFER